MTSPIFWIDATAPLVSNSTPAAAATGVDVSAPFTIIFSESMDRISANGSISLSPGTWTLTFTWSANSKTVTVDHTPALATDTQYLLSVGTSALDASDPGNFLGTAYQASFHTSTAAAVTANAGGPYTGHVGDTITLDGSQSTGAGLNYTWAIVRRGGGGSAFVYGQRPTYTFTAEGVYDIGLVVRDSSGNVDTDTTTATISAAQQPSDFLSQYWWVLLILIIAIVAALLFLVMGRRRKKEEAPGEQTPAAPSRPPSRPAAPPPRAAPVAGTTAQGAKPQTRECPSCGTIVDVTDTECFMCGTKL
ncbi:MAG TPA: Ig-like domain-containing protein [Thermoplasmata archaeon]|nr:Ig-like domain-containing protein [Thermoplasmata archaeon]